MRARIKNPALVFPGALDGLAKLRDSIAEAGIPDTTIFLIETRASQINGCGVCLDIHTRELQHAEEPIAKILAIAAWRETPYFSDAERAALALTEAATRLSDATDPVSDQVWDEAARHYSETQLAALLIAIATINAWNRLKVPTKEVGGDWVEKIVRRVPQPA